MSIPHFADLKLDDLLRVVNHPVPILRSCKIDGSYVEFGLEDNGRAYLQRGKSRYYSLDDWPAQPWTNPFRVAHTLLVAYLEALVDTDMIKSPIQLSAEIVNGRQPNTIVYDDGKGKIFILDLEPVYTKGIIQFTHQFKSRIDQPVMISKDGIDIEWQDQIHEWKLQPIFAFQPKYSSFNGALSLFGLYLNKRLKTSSRVPGFTVEQVLNLKFNKRPDWIEIAKWRELLPDLKQERRLLEDELHEFKDQIASQSLVDLGTHEGLVFQIDDLVFKITDRNHFTGANRFTHWVKYALVGSRRPPRPCFLSRTADWPKERRLARLDVLRRRYLENRHKLNLMVPTNISKSGAIHYEGDLHDRTLLLFADVRQRIINGR